MLDIINFKDKYYPHFQSIGNASQFALPFAKLMCKGLGVDVGCGKMEWKLPNAFPIDPVIDPRYDALKFPDWATDLDYIYSSHCLEHLDSWVDALDYWMDRLKKGGVLFLYLPHPSQEYWLPWNNRKHKHVLNPEDLKKYFIDKKVVKHFTTSFDLNSSYYSVIEK